MQKKEFLEGYRSFIFFVVTTLAFMWFIYRGEGLQAYWTWAVTCAGWLGKNYFSARANIEANKKPARRRAKDVVDS